MTEVEEHWAFADLTQVRLTVCTESKADVQWRYSGVKTENFTQGSVKVGPLGGVCCALESLRSSYLIRV